MVMRMRVQQKPGRRSGDGGHVGGYGHAGDDEGDDGADHHVDDYNANADDN